jgi:type IV pilus assembly protein PilB
VLSTLHTNDAPNAVTRLVDMGLEAYKLASALRGIVAQRLMRRLCLTCRETNTGEIPAKLKRFLPEGVTLYRSVGCPECTMTGFRGRYSIVEVLTMSPELERRIGAGMTADKIAEAARENGMKSLWESGLRHVLAGDSSLDELLRVTAAPVTETATAAPIPAAPRHSAPPVAAPPPSPTPVAHIDLSTAFDLVDEAPPASAKSGKRQATVLLVDDEDQLRRVMRDLLEREGYAVAEARDGVQALDEVDRHAPDVIVLDLNLPGLDGYSVLSQLRSRQNTKSIPVIVLTAKGDEDNEVRVFELGADDFLTKPFRARALSARLEALLGRRRS